MVNGVCLHVFQCRVELYFWLSVMLPSNCAGKLLRRLHVCLCRVEVFLITVFVSFCLLPTCILCCAFVCVFACLSICPHGCPCVDVYRTEVTFLNHEQIALDYLQEMDDVTGLVNMSAFCIQEVNYICQVCLRSQCNPSWAPRTHKDPICWESWAIAWSSFYICSWSEYSFYYWQAHLPFSCQLSQFIQLHYFLVLSSHE